MASELAIRNRIVRELRARGAYVLVTTGVSMSGTPDLLVCFKGRFIALEVKGEKGRPSQLQLVRLNEITRAGGRNAIVRSVEEALECLPS